MRILYLLSSLFVFYSFSVHADNHSLIHNTLTIYTYDSFVSEWGPGPKIKKIFEEKFKRHLEFVSVDSAATLLTKIILEGSSTKADIVLGLDMNLFNAANKSNLFLKHRLEHLNNKIDLPIEWESENFIPYNFGYYAFVYTRSTYFNSRLRPPYLDEIYLR